MQLRVFRVHVSITKNVRFDVALRKLSNIGYCFRCIFRLDVREQCASILVSI